MEFYSIFNIKQDLQIRSIPSDTVSTILDQTQLQCHERKTLVLYTTLESNFFKCRSSSSNSSTCSSGSSSDSGGAIDHKLTRIQGLGQYPRKTQQS